MINTCTLLYFSHTNLSVIIWTSVWLFSFIQSNIQISTYLIIEIYIINSIYIFSLKLTLISLQHQIIQKLCLIFNHDYILNCNNNLTRFRRFVKRNNQTLLEKSHTLQFHVRTFFLLHIKIILFLWREGRHAPITCHIIQLIQLFTFLYGMIHWSLEWGEFWQSADLSGNVESLSQTQFQFVTCQSASNGFKAKFIVWINALKIAYVKFFLRFNVQLNAS